MGTTTKLTLAALAAGLAACASNKETDAAKQADFSRDLQLASATTMDLAAPKVNPSLLTSLETQPHGAPDAASVVKRGAGSRAVRSSTPTVHAAPQDDVAADDDNSDLTQIIDEAPAPEVSEPVAVAPRPAAVPVIMPAGPNAGGDYGTGSGGGGVLGGGGGIGGVVIRGGGVDGDHCEIPGRGRRGGIIVGRGPVYTMPNPTDVSVGRRIPGPTPSGTIGTRRTSSPSGRPGVVTRRVR